MKILVTTASRHGATENIGDVVAEVLREAGHEVGRCSISEQDEVGDVLDPSGYDAVVLGGSVYTGTWLQRATRAQDLLLERELPVYAFAVGVLDITPDVTQERWTSPRTAQTAGERVTFGGTIAREGLSMRERSLLAVVRAKEGEYTDWDSVNAWAGAIAADIDASSVSSPS